MSKCRGELSEPIFSKTFSIFKDMAHVGIYRNPTVRQFDNIKNI